MFNAFKDIQKSYLNVYEKFTNTNVSEEHDKKNLINVAAKTSLVSEKFLKCAKKLSGVAQEGAGKLNTFVTKHTIIGEIQKENENFKNSIRKDQTKSDNKLLNNNLPWEDLSDIEGAKKQILALSLDERNFLVDSPLITEQNININSIAQKLLLIDARLQKMRYNLVPKKISEEKFWNNYFYRISLIKKLFINDKNNIMEEKQNLTVTENKDSQNIINSNNDNSKSLLDNVKNTSNSLLADEDWEKELLNDINEFELVENNGLNQRTEIEWNEEIKVLLNEEALNLQIKNK